MNANISGVLVSNLVPGILPAAALSWPRGADGTIQITVRDDSGTLVNLTGSTIELGLRVSDAAPVPVFSPRAATLNDPTHGVAVFALAAADTSGLATGRYRYDVWLTNNNGRRPLIQSSDFIVLEADTRPGEGTSSAIISPVTNGAVDTVNTTGTTLAGLDASHLTDGFLVWVREAGQGYWHIEVGKGYPIDSTHIAALGLAGGQWVRGLATAIASVVSAADVAGLALIPTVGLATGQQAWVQTPALSGGAQMFVLQAATAGAANGINVVATADDNTRQWIQQGILSGIVSRFETAELDLTTPSDLNAYIPGIAGYHFVMFTGKYFLTQTAGVLSTSPTFQIGNNATEDNYVPPTTTSISAPFAVGAPVTASTTATQNPTLKNVAGAPITVKIGTGATGSGGFVLKGRFVCSGAYFPA